MAYWYDPPVMDETPEIENFTEQLEQLSDVTQFDEPEQKQAPLVAEGLVHISESAATFRSLLDKLREPGLSEEEQLDLLWDIGEELRHIDEHIHDMAYFDEQIEPDEPGGKEPLDS